MSRIGTSSRSPIGIDVGSRTTKAVQVTRRGSATTITAATIFPRALPDSAIDGSEVRRMIDVMYRHNFHGQDIVISAPPLRVLDATLELPKSADASGHEQLARMEFARLQKCEPGALEMGYWPLPAGPRSHNVNRVMAVGCLHRDVEPLLEIFESEGLRVVSMDAEACALARACSPRLADHSGLTGLLDFGWHCSRLSVMYQGAIVFSRVLSESGLSSLFKPIERQLELDTPMAEHVLRELGVRPPVSETEDPIADARRSIAAHFDAMVQELNVSFSYATQQYPDASLQRLLVTGGGAQITGVVEELSTRLGLECAAVAPSDLCRASPALVQLCGSPALTVALGLAQFCDQ